ncbi:MAG: sugar ABC transporter permease, partial [Anaerolineales bacterium]|nr:sugar ABC transporter permease [Anaerolineales bacterium]
MIKSIIPFSKDKIVTANPKPRKKLSLTQKDNLWGYLFITPTMLGFLLFVLGPLVAIFVFSVQERNLLTGQVDYIGFENYSRMLLSDPLFKKTMINSLVFTAGFVPLDIGLGLLLAVLLDRLKGGISRLFQVIFFSPVVTSAVAWAIVWKFILQGQNGVANQVLALIGISGPNWLYEPHTAMFSVIFTRALKVVGLNMVIFMSALANIPDDYRD